MNTMKDTSLTRSASCNLILLAALPTEDLLATAYELDDPALPFRDAKRQAASIQAELIVVSLFKQYVENQWPRAATVAPERQLQLLGIPIERLVGPPGAATATFRATFLADPQLDLAREFTIAHDMQTHNAVPADVPPIGRLLTKAQTGIGGPDTPLVAPQAMKALLMAQACLRAMLPPDARRPELLMRTNPSDAKPLRLAQEIANRILLSPEPHAVQELSLIHGLSDLAEQHLILAGFPGFAAAFSELREHVVMTSRPGRPNGPMGSALAPEPVMGGEAAHARPDR